MKFQIPICLFILFSCTVENQAEEIVNNVSVDEILNFVKKDQNASDILSIDLKYREKDAYSPLLIQVNAAKSCSCSGNVEIVANGQGTSLANCKKIRSDVKTLLTSGVVQKEEREGYKVYSTNILFNDSSNIKLPVGDGVYEEKTAYENKGDHKKIRLKLVSFSDSLVKEKYFENSAERNGRIIEKLSEDIYYYWDLSENLGYLTQRMNNFISEPQ